MIPGIPWDFIINNTDPVNALMLVVIWIQLIGMWLHMKIEMVRVKSRQTQLINVISNKLNWSFQKTQEPGD